MTRRKYFSQYSFTKVAALTLTMHEIDSAQKTTLFRHFNEIAAEIDGRDTLSCHSSRSSSVRRDLIKLMKQRRFSRKKIAEQSMCY